MKKRMLFIAFIMLVFATLNAQLTTAAGGGNKKAWVGEKIGLTNITIHYDRPGLKGREGKIWGQLVHKGFADLGFGTSKAAPWRAGANENTTIEFSRDVKVEGQPLKAGKYALFIAYDSLESTVILSKNSSSWGSFFYDPKEDALKVKVKPVRLNENVEWLRYEFLNQTDNSATIALQWERLQFPFKVEVDYLNDQLESFRNELRGDKSFSLGWRPYQEAAQFTLSNNVGLEEGLQWADLAIHDRFVGNANFSTLSTKAGILAKLGRAKEADSLMKRALSLGSMQEIHQHGRSLLAQKRTKEALEVFKMNHEKNPNSFTTLMGLTRGYSAIGDYQNALKYAKLALPLAPPGQNKTFVEGAIKKLEEGKDIN